MACSSAELNQPTKASLPLPEICVNGTLISETELAREVHKDPQLFAALAKDYSACPSKETAGNPGQITKGQTTPELERQLFTLPEGLADKPIESRYGFHVVHLDRRIDGVPLPLENAKEQIATYLNEQALHTAITQYLHQLLDAADIQGVDILGYQDRMP